MIDNSQMGLGKKLPKHDARTLQFASYIDADALALKPPPRVKWSARMSAVGMMLNDRYGCCTCSGAGHMIQAWTANNGSQVIISDADVLKAYEAFGYVQGQPNTDQGANELEVLNYWRNTGIGGHKIYGYVAQEPKNRQHVELAVDLLGGCYLGIALPVSAQRQRAWSVVGGPDSAPGSWGGHAVPIVDYGPTGPVCITWGKLVTMTWKFFEKYCDEAYGVLSADWAQPGRAAPSGFDFAALQADLAQIAH